MVNPVVFFVSRFVMNGVMHIHILIWISGPFLFCSTAVVLYQCTIFLPNMWWICTFLPVLFSGVGRDFTHEYFTPKSLNTKVKLIVKLTCVHISGSFLEMWFTWGSRCWNRAYFAIHDACGGPYISLVTRAKMYPFSTLYLRLYFSTNYCGIMDICIMIYSDLSIWFFR